MNGCYLVTPPESQGLAPHWDDVDVFVLQMEGTKMWKLHERTESENQYPLTSSGDINFKDIDDAKLIMQCTLNPGDLLYFPRGTVEPFFPIHFIFPIL